MPESRFNDSRFTVKTLLLLLRLLLRWSSSGFGSGSRRSFLGACLGRGSFLRARLSSRRLLGSRCSSALFLLLFGHFHIDRSASGRFGSSSFLRFRDRGGDGDYRNAFFAEDFYSGRGLDVAQMK